MFDFEHNTSFQIRIDSRSSVQGNTYLRVITKSGVSTFKYLTNGAYTTESFTFDIDDYPIAVSINDPEENFNQSRNYSVISLLMNGDKVQELAAGYVYQTKSLSWPNTNTADIVPGLGRLTLQSLGDPAAGAEYSFTPGTDRWYKLLAAKLVLVTDATVANRNVHFVIGSTTTPYFNFIASANVPANTTRNFTVAPMGAFTSGSEDNDTIIPIPKDIWLDSNYKITTETTNLQAGDNFGAGVVWFEEFLSA